jgi:transcriptional regulator with XRE-family HTH domain
MVEYHVKRNSGYGLAVAKSKKPEIISAEVIRLLRQERQAQNLSVYRVAKDSGLSQQMIHYVERGMRNPTLDTLLRIAEALDVDLSRLIKRASVTTASKK